MIDLRIFHNFLKVINLGSVSRAAEQVGLTQSALSQQIAALENEFKTALLHRTSKGVRPTEAGQIVAGRLQVIVNQFDTARQEIRSTRELPTGTVCIGLPSSVAEILSVPLVIESRKRYPGIHLSIAASPNRWLCDEMLTNRLDFAITFEASPHKELHHYDLGIERFYLICERNSVNAGKKHAGLHSLEKSDLVLPCRPHIIRMILDRRCAAENIELNILAEVDSLSNIIDLVASGEYESILPWSALARHVEQGSTVAIPFDSEFNRKVSVSVLSEVPLSESAVLTLQLMLEVIQKLVGADRWKGLKLKPDPALIAACDHLNSTIFRLTKA